VSDVDDLDLDPNAIAIVGMAAHLPGARNTEEFWANLTSGTESIRFWTDEELLAEGESPARVRHPRYVKASAPVPDMELFDAEFFGFSPKEAAILDPQHRHFLECAWEALEDAGHVPDTFDGPIGVFGGCGMGSYFYFNLCSNPELVDSVGMFLLRHTGNDKDFLVTRVSHVFDLEGPSVNVQTACSTSLVAVHFAAQSLLNQECDLALAGGVTIELPHRRGYVFEEGEILSPDGHCHAFDHRAQGTVFGSGAGVVALRRLEDAVRDGDRIHAVIKSTAINNDGGRKAGYLAPSVSGQAACIVEAHTMADVDADSIGYVECHGTGTYLGDPIEISALTDAFRQTTDAKQFCRIGSVKTNIGHLDTAAGVASLIKSSLILEREQIPPSLGFEKPNPTIDFEASPFLVNAELTEWKRGDEPRRVGVQSLGVGGTNAHVVLEEAPLREPSAESRREVQLVTISGRTKGALEGNTERLAEHLADHPDENLADVAYTLHAGRRAFERRRVVVAATAEEAQELLDAKDRFRVHTHSALEKPSLAFLFPGGGAQYVGMGMELYETEPLFREILDRGFAYLSEREVDFDLKALLFADPSDEAETALRPLERQLPATFLCSYAMARVLEAGPAGLEGVRADAFGGHSMGEYVAACLTGVFDFEEALGLVLLRGRLMDSTAEGAMLAVPLSEAETRARMGGDLDLAGINAPQLTVVSGSPSAVDAFEAKLKAEEIEARRVDIARAAHSRLFDPILAPFREYVAKMALRAPDRPFVSSKTGTWITPQEATDPDYWTDHIRQPVRFADAIGTLAEAEDRVFVEVGPGKALSSFAKQHPKVDSQAVVSSFRHQDEAVRDDDYLLELVGRLWALGAPIDLGQLWEGERRLRVSLPTYAFQRQHYFIEPGERRTEAPGLEKEEDVRDWGWTPVWRPAAAPFLDSLDELSERDPESWLVFLDDAGLGERVVSRLRQAGHGVTLVRPGDTFAKMSDGSYVISPERGREGYDLMVQDLVKAGTVPSRVLHLWLTTQDESHRPGSSFFHRNQERGFYSLLFLAQAIADENLPRPLALTVITSDAQRVAGEALPHPEKALTLGPALVTPRELSGVHVRTLDVRLPAVQKRLFGGKLAMALVDPFAGRKQVTAGLDALADTVLEEALADPGSSVAALREGKRFERTFRRRPLEPAAEVPRLRDGGVYVITGGLGGLGLVAAEEIARAAKSPTLVLLGRRGLPDRDGWDAYAAERGDTDPTALKIARVRELEAQGATVIPAQADVTNVAQMRALLEQVREAHGPVRGVVHTAGVVRDELLQMKGLSTIEEVFAPKVHGTLVLDELVVREGAPHAKECDFVLLYSSTSTAIAPTGQVDYVAANAFLDAYAEQRASEWAEGPRVTSLHWGIWRDVGMAAEAFDRTDLSAGPDELPPTEGPFFQGRVRDARGLTHLVATIAPESQWLLDEHRTLPIGGAARGPALVPGTGVVEIITQGMRELEGERARPMTLRDLYFLRPLQVDDGDTREVRLGARRSDAGYQVQLRSRCTVEGRPAWQLHAQAEVALGDVPTPASVDLDALRARCTENVRHDESGLRSPQEKHLDFGPRWRVLREERYGEREAYGRLALPDAYAADHDEGWILHPAVLDLATGFAMGLIEGYTPSHVWVPVSYESLTVHAPLTREIHSWARSAGTNRGTDEFAFFDVTLTDPTGRVLAEITRFAIRKLEADAGFAMAKAPTRAEVEFDAVAAADPDRPLSPAEQRLQRNFERGIERAEGGDALRRVLARMADDRPLPEVFATSLDLQGLIAQAGESLAEGKAAAAKFARPELESDYLGPRNAIERTLVGFWEELLGVDRVGVQDSFFDLGGHSLIAVRLFAMVKKAYQVEFPISVLFEAPTIEACAALIQDAGVSVEGEGEAEAPAKKKAAPKRRFTHLVPMHPGEGGERQPFFLVAGMFGNVLNLRHLAHLVGTDRPFYGLQARGLYGDQEPHETFEEAARDYLKEIRQVQPEGPYLLGGFSGGGYIAMEMGRQLKEAGEEVGLLVLLDTPGQLVPEDLSLEDRLRIQTQRFEQKGPKYFLEWAENRLEWELGKLRKRFEEPEEAPTTEFHDEAIEAAFRRALGRYEIRKWDQPIELFRPPLEEAYVLGPGRILNHDREYVYDDNGWSRFCDQVRVHVVPGDHDSMVLEPNVRVLASTLRDLLGAADQGRPARRSGSERVGATIP